MTERVKEIVRRYALGESHKVIGAALRIGRKTVEFHLSKFKAETRIFDRPTIIHYCLHHGICANIFADKPKAIDRGPAFIPKKPDGRWKNSAHSRLSTLRNVGDCVDIDRSLGNIHKSAQRLGIGVVTRQNTDKTFRVWRTDGKPIAEVNRLIELREGKLKPLAPI